MCLHGKPLEIGILSFNNIAIFILISFILILIYCYFYAGFLNFYRSPALITDTQSSNKNSKTEEGKFEIENRRRAEKLLKKQFGLKPVDSWRKHKKALNAAKYFEELPAATEKISSNPEPKAPLETKPDLKIIKIVKSNKKTSTISLPVTKQINSPESPVTVLNPPTPEVVKKPIASVAPYQIVQPKQPAVTIVQPERTAEKLNISKSKPVQIIQNKPEKEPITMRPVISKKSISEDDGLLAEYKYMKKKNKSERKASLPPPTPTTPPSIPSPPTTPALSSPPTPPAAPTSPAPPTPPVPPTLPAQPTPPAPPMPSVIPIIKPKIETVERCNMSEVAKPKIKEVIVPAVKEKEIKEVSQTYNQKIAQHPEIEKKITVLKRGSDKSLVDLSPTTTNKHGNNSLQFTIYNQFLLECLLSLSIDSPIGKINYYLYLNDLLIKFPIFIKYILELNI